MKENYFFTKKIYTLSSKYIILKLDY